MALFVVSYDLIKLKDYATLIQELERLGGHRPTLSTWFVSLNSTASEVRAHLAGFVDEDDQLIVVEFSEKPAFTKARSGTNDWIARHF